MKQLSLNVESKSTVKIVASSSYDYRIEIIEDIGQHDIDNIIEISKDLSDVFGNNFLMTNSNIVKYFNKNTLPFIARYKGKIIGYIIGAPIEHFHQESWSRYDTNLGKNNTIYTYAFIISKQFRKRGGFSKTLKLIYLNWAKKRGFKYVTGHVTQGLSKRFSKNTEVIKTFENWYGSEMPYEYYRRLL
tara:strand:- start:86 stop:649 length:564 start_codon:yes stop_codon:yes gene_type:complete